MPEAEPATTQDAAVELMTRPGRGISAGDEQYGQKLVPSYGASTTRQEMLVPGLKVPRTVMCWSCLTFAQSTLGPALTEGKFVHQRTVAIKYVCFVCTVVFQNTITE